MSAFAEWSRADGRLHAGHALVAALALLVALLAWQAVVRWPEPVPVPPAAPLPILTDRALLAATDPFFPGGTATGEALPVTALPFSLHGLRFDAVTGRGSAIIAGDDGVQQVREVGEDVGGGVRLVAVATDHVVLDRSGIREALWLDNANQTPVQTYTPPAATPEPPALEGMPEGGEAGGAAGPADRPTGDASGDGDGSGAAVVPVPPAGAPARMPS